MPCSAASLTQVVSQRRTEAASLWLARSRKTASRFIRAMIGTSRVTIHAVPSGSLLFSLEWADQMIMLKKIQSDESYHFHEMASAVILFESVISSYIVFEDELPSKGCHFTELTVPQTWAVSRVVV